MLACAGGHAEAAELLAERTAQAGLINVQDGSYKRSALHEASHEGLTDTVAKLLSLGADATLTDRFGRTPVDLEVNRRLAGLKRQRGREFPMTVVGSNFCPDLVGRVFGPGDTS